MSNVNYEAIKQAGGYGDAYVVDKVYARRGICPPQKIEKTPTPSWRMGKRIRLIDVMVNMTVAAKYRRRWDVSGTHVGEEKYNVCEGVDIVYQIYEMSYP